MYNRRGQQSTTGNNMFYIRKRSIKYGNEGAFVAHLLQTGSDVHMGMVKNSGIGATMFYGVNPHVSKMVQAVANHFEIPMDYLMDYYMDIAEGFYEAEKKPLVMAIASYKPE